MTWDEIKLLQQEWDGLIVLKGIQHVEDAKLAGCSMKGSVVEPSKGWQGLDRRYPPGQLEHPARAYVYAIKWLPLSSG